MKIKANSSVTYNVKFVIKSKFSVLKQFTYLKWCTPQMKVSVPTKEKHNLSNAMKGFYLEASKRKAQLIWGKSKWAHNLSQGAPF